MSYFVKLSSEITKQTTVEPRSKAPAYKAMSTYKAFKQNPQHIFCTTFYIGSKA